MSRIVKNPEERKFELITAAENLFSIKGFEQTLVSDITQKIGVAQGTFYYYFSSKDDVMIAVLEKEWAELASSLSADFTGRLISPFEQLAWIFAQFFSPHQNGEALWQRFPSLQITGLPDRFHVKFDEMRTEIFAPLICKIIQAGIEQKIFRSLNHPEEITQILFTGINAYMHIHSPRFHEQSYFIQKVEALSELLEIVLGLEKGSFHFSSTL